MEIEDTVRMQRPGKSLTHLGVVSCPNLNLPACIERESGVVSDIFVTWDGATPEFESSNQIAEGIIMLVWHILNSRKRV